MAQGRASLSLRLSERITIRRSTSTRDASGGRKQSWADFATVWAEVVNVSGRETVIGQALAGVSTFRITIRMQPSWRNSCGPKTSDQVLWRGLELNIVAPPADPNGRGDALMFLADTTAAQGA